MVSLHQILKEIYSNETKIIFLLLSIIMLTNHCNGSASLDEGREEYAAAGEVRKRMVVMGSAFSDIIVSWPHADFSSYDAELYAGRFLDKDQFLRFKARLEEPTIVPGGSAANATEIFAQLGVKASFYSTVGKDKEGETWRASLNNLGVDMQLHICDSEPTGGCLIYVHPGGERSMRTYGGTENVADNNLDSINFDEKPIVFVEWYALSSKAKASVFLEALQRAKEKGSFIVISDSDPFCIKNQRDRFIELLQTTADLII